MSTLTGLKRNELGCLVSPEGGSVGYSASGCNAVKEVVVLT